MYNNDRFPDCELFILPMTFDDFEENWYVYTLLNMYHTWKAALAYVLLDDPSKSSSIYIVLSIYHIEKYCRNITFVRLYCVVFDLLMPAKSSQEQSSHSKYPYVDIGGSCSWWKVEESYCSASCVFSCSRRFLFRVNRREYLSHWNGFSPSCTSRWCPIKYSQALKATEHCSHQKGLSWVCVVLCLWRLPGYLKLRGHLWYW